ncbi:MAG: helix-turn-helix domain-containing protein [Candidatus Pacearchaeota archaeon]
MVLRDDFLSRLREIFGLNLYEVKIWTALLSRGVSTAGELSNISGVPRSRTYDILESLEKKGFVIMKLGKPIKFIALKPSEVIDRAKRNFIEQAKEKGKVLEEIRDSELMDQLNEIYTKSIKYVEPHELSGALRGRYNIVNHIDSLINKAQNEVIIVTTEKGFERKIDSLRSTLEKVAKRGVNLKICAPITKNNFKIAKEVSKFAEVRDVKINARFIVIDDRILVFMVLDDAEIHPNYDLGVWINSEFFTTALKNLFEETWKRATPISKLKI